MFLEGSFSAVLKLKDSAHKDGSREIVNSPVVFSSLNTNDGLEKGGNTSGVEEVGCWACFRGQTFTQDVLLDRALHLRGVKESGC